LGERCFDFCHASIVPTAAGKTQRHRKRITAPRQQNVETVSYANPL
jgi:hypothetical protein